MSADQEPRRDAPWVGPESDDYRAVCLYAPVPGAPRCDDPATAHILVADEKYGTVSLVACDRHASTARAAAPVVDEHRHEGVCGFPSTLWMANPSRCVLDDSGEEPALVARADTKAAST